MTKEQLLTVREVARRCHRSEETVRRWIWGGKLRARKLGNQLFVSADEVDRIGTADADRAAPQRRRYTKEELFRQLEEDRKFSEEMRTKYGLADVAELVRQTHEDD